MSYLRDKDELREAIRETRDEMLKKARKKAEERKKRELQKMLASPSWSKMLEKETSKYKVSKSKTSPLKKSKKMKKSKTKRAKAKKPSTSKEKRNRKAATSSDESDDEHSEESDGDSEVQEMRKKHKKTKQKRKRKYTTSEIDSSEKSSDSGKKRRKRKKRRKSPTPSITSTSDVTTDDEATAESTSEDSAWLERSSTSAGLAKKHKTPPTATITTSSMLATISIASTSNPGNVSEVHVTAAPAATTSSMQRDSWMTATGDSFSLQTYTRGERVKKKPNEQQQIDAYDPALSARELNPYWKSTGTGLPAFQKPRDDNDEAQLELMPRRVSQQASVAASGSSSRSWRKQTEAPASTSAQQRVHSPSPAAASRAPTNTSTVSASEGEDEAGSVSANASVNEYLTDQQMNELGAKLLKAEITGNNELAAELTRKLEQARANRAAQHSPSTESSNPKSDKQETKQKRGDEEEQHVLLTHTDERGNSRPLPQARSTYAEPNDPYGGRRGRKKPQKRVETHADGERMRYFADDDNYDIKQMFEREKYTSAADSNLQFANIASKHKNPNDDLEDIFDDEIRKHVAPADMDNRERQRAIREHKRLSLTLDNCYNCFNSSRIDKNLVISYGEKCYLSLPMHIGLQTGHCVLSPMQHLSCCTQLDEDAWEELTNYRRALTTMFAAQHKDVIFFEIANKLFKRPHLMLHCVPIPMAQGELAPFYFKKAIEESETEWSVNRQLVSLRGTKNVRNCIPKGLPYFWVNFGMDSGFAHVIEDEGRFPANYALEIIGGMLYLDPHHWRHPEREHNIIPKVIQFTDKWRKYNPMTH